MKKVRIIVAGGRDFEDYELLSATLLGTVEKLINKNILEESSHLPHEQFVAIKKQSTVFDC